MKKSLTYRITILCLLFATVCTLMQPACSSVLAADSSGAESSMDRESLIELVSQLNTPVLFGEAETTFQIDGYTFHKIDVLRLVAELYGDTGHAVFPLEWDERVSALKEYLRDTFGENYYVSYTQLRPEVIGCLDEQFSVLIETIYLFTDTQRDIVLDDYTEYLVTHLIDLSEEMRGDIYRVYKHLLISRGLEGNLNRDGRAEGLYFYAQTDSDWAAYPFPNSASSTEYNDTVMNRSCGVMSFNMVAAAYLHHEVDPLELVDYVLDNGYRIEASGVDDMFFHTAAEYYGISDPTIYYAADGINWDFIVSKVRDENRLAIVHEYTGPFTSRQHYMVLEGYEEIDGIGYFLVADPYVLKSRYSRTDQMQDARTNNDGILYATPEVIADTCSAVSLFDADKTDWDMTAQAANAEQMPSTAPGGTAE